MDWKAFVDMVSPVRLEVLGIALGLTIVLGILGALKSKSFKWTLVASFLQPSLNFFWLTLGYLATAFVATALDKSWEPAVIGSYVFVVAAMLAKIKDQLAFLAPNLPLANWRLPFETQ